MGKFNPLVTIIIPVYNGENYLSEAIDSALAQTYKNLQIIVVNDGSKDNGATEKIAKSYGNKIEYYSKPNGGTSTALNEGLRHMKGEYFSWLSHDDTYYPTKIADEVEVLEKLKDKNTIILSDLDGIDENYNQIYRTNYIDHIKAYPPREKSMLHPIIYNQTHGCTLLIPKACFDTVGWFDEKELVAQDFEFFYRAFKVFPHKLLPKVLVTARDSSNRQGRRSHHKGDVEYSRLFIKMIEEFTDEEILELAPSRRDFYIDMENFFRAAGYSIALDYIRKKLCSNVQISSYDLTGQRFNGHDLHLYLNEMGKQSVQIVRYKQSNDRDTYAYNFDAVDATKCLLQQSIVQNAAIVHLHLVHNIFDINYLPILSRVKPTVLTLHDPFYLGGHCIHHFDCDKWKSMCLDCLYLDRDFKLTDDISTYNFELKKNAVQQSKVTAIVASDWMMKKAEQSPIWRGKKIYKVPFGVDQEKFHPGVKESIRKELQIPANDTVIMLRADAGYFKGTDLVIHALEKNANKNNITIISVGAIGLLKSLEDGYKVKEYGWVQDEQLMIKLYQASDVFFMPSRQETFGVMAVEAMSCGLPVVVLNAEGSALPEVVNAPDVGYVFEEKTFDKQTSDLLKNREELAKRGRSCLNYAQKHYSKEVYVENILNVYQEVIDNWNQNEEDKILSEQLEKYSVNQCSLEPITFEQCVSTVGGDGGQSSYAVAQLQAMEKTLSWRITRPLRLVRKAQISLKQEGLKRTLKKIFRRKAGK